MSVPGYDPSYAKYIDHTVLKCGTTRDTVRRFCDEAPTARRRVRAESARRGGAPPARATKGQKDPKRCMFRRPRYDGHTSLHARGAQWVYLTALRKVLSAP